MAIKNLEPRVLVY